jgi:hypothetical protein
VQSWGGMRWEARVLTLALVVLVATSVVIALGGWYLTCTDPGGAHLGGIDCFQYVDAYVAHNAPARWLGFWAWVAIWSAALVTAIAMAWRLRRVGRRADAYPRMGGGDDGHRPAARGT